jgi:hypothetical protein
VLQSGVRSVSKMGNHTPIIVINASSESDALVAQYRVYQFAEAVVITGVSPADIASREIAREVCAVTKISRIRRNLADPLSDFITADVWKADVQKDHIGLQRLCRLHCLKTR